MPKIKQSGKQRKNFVEIEDGISNDGERIRYQIMAKRPTDTDTTVNRIRSAVDEMTGLADPDDRMLEFLNF